MKKILAVDDMKGWRDHHFAVLKEICKDDVAIDLASSGQEAYEMVYNNLNEPYDLIITDLQMETTHEPDYAGEWLVKQVKMLKQYASTKIVIISAAYNIRTIAKNLGVFCVPKSTAAQHASVYESLFSR